MKTILLFSILTLGQLVHGQMGTIQGALIDENNETVLFAKVLVYSGDPSNETLVTGVQSDIDGRFRIDGVEPGIYNLVISEPAMGLDTLHIDEVEVKAEEITFLGEIIMNYSEMEIIYCHFGMPVTLYTLEMDPFGRSVTINPEDIRRP